MVPLAASRTRRVEGHHHVLGSVLACGAETEATAGSGCVPPSPWLTGRSARPVEDPVELALIPTPCAARRPRDPRPRPGAGPVSGRPPGTSIVPASGEPYSGAAPGVLQ